MARVGRHVIVRGRVQGVFFRAWTAEQAQALGVSGWVRNASDGSVEAHIEGDENGVQRLIELLHGGPPAAQVEKVDVEVAECKGGNRFEVRH
jgi:acylphosphatase